MSENWYDEGFAKTEEIARERQRQQDKQKVRRVWMKAGNFVEVLILDDKSFSFWEHDIRSEGKWGNHYTCLANMKGANGLPMECPACLASNKRYYITLIPVIDMTAWTDKQGKKHQYEKKVLALKEQPALLIKQKKEQWGGLKNRFVRITRKGEKDFSSGSDFELMLRDGKVIEPRKEWLDKMDTKPFNFPDLFRPGSYADMASAVGKAARGENDAFSSQVGSGGAGAADPFYGNEAPPHGDDAAPPAGGVVDIEHSEIPF